jgi:hypothetical protein
MKRISQNAKGRRNQREKEMKRINVKTQKLESYSNFHMIVTKARSRLVQKIVPVEKYFNI